MSLKLLLSVKGMPAPPPVGFSRRVTPLTVTLPVPRMSVRTPDVVPKLFNWKVIVLNWFLAKVRSPLPVIAPPRISVRVVAVASGSCPLIVEAAATVIGLFHVQLPWAPEPVKPPTASVPPLRVTASAEVLLPRASQSPDTLLRVVRRVAPELMIHLPEKLSAPVVVGLRSTRPLPAIVIVPEPESTPARLPAPTRR